jgi:GAF domain-containing protein
MDRETVLSRLEEIIVNFVGSEEFGVYEHTRGDELRRIAHVGLRDDVDPRLLQDLLAGIPLEIDEKRVGYIAIHRLLPHKPALEPADLELFNLLKTHAAAALLASRPSHDAQ